MIAALRSADAQFVENDGSKPEDSSMVDRNTRSLTPEEMKEIATIVDEMRHLRKQWLSQTTKPTTTSNAPYGTSRK